MEVIDIYRYLCYNKVNVLVIGDRFDDSLLFLKEIGKFGSEDAGLIKTQKDIIKFNHGSNIKVIPFPDRDSYRGMMNSIDFMILLNMSEGRLPDDFLWSVRPRLRGILSLRWDRGDL